MRSGRLTVRSKEGRAKVMVAGGAEASVNEIGIAGFCFDRFIDAN